MWVRSQGTVAPRTESDLVPEVSGRVTWVSPALVSGGFFSEGEPLLRIDPRDYEAALARAHADVARAEGEAEHAQAELRRQLGLARSKANSPSQLSNARRAERVASATLEAARVSLDQAQRDLARTEIVAPFDGRVREEQVDVGQFVSRGVRVATVYATDFAEIRLPLADRQLAYLDLPGLRGATTAGGVTGPEVRLRANFAGVEHTWVGRVVRTEGEIDPRSRMVHVVARVEDPYGMEATGADEGPPAEPVGTPPGPAASGAAHEGAPRPAAERPAAAAPGHDDFAPLAVGLFVHAEIAGEVAKDVIVVPRSTIRDGDRILVVDADDRLRHRPVDVLRIDRDEVLIRTDIAPGERIVVSPIQVVVEGMPVRPISTEEGPRS
jgi:RND family efflux transporter MFP subunit